MSSNLALPTPITSARGAVPGPASARLAVYSAPGEPPQVDELADGDPGGPHRGAVRRGLRALGSARPGGARGDREPGPRRLRRRGRQHPGRGPHPARQRSRPGDRRSPARPHPGVTSAGPEVRAIVRGVGGGLPLAQELMAEQGGRLEIADNLGGGASVTLRTPAPPAPRPSPRRPARRPPARSSRCCSRWAARPRRSWPTSSASAAPTAAASWSPSSTAGWSRAIPRAPAASPTPAPPSSPPSSRHSPHPPALAHSTLPMEPR